MLLAAMGGIGTAAVVSDGPGGLVASHVPVEVDPEPAPLGRIRCHFALPNPQLKAIGEGQELLFIFQGPLSYVTPSWYPTKRRTGKVVPTLNYVAVHAYGTVSAFLDGDALRAYLAALTGRFESSNDAPWKIDDAPADYISRLCAGPLPASRSI
jgi:transcriptional regulator